jgi:membrane protein involved in colicin uptake
MQAERTITVPLSTTNPTAAAAADRNGEVCALVSDTTRTSEFEQFLNEPPSYENLKMVREYRHEAYPKWRAACDELRAKLAAECKRADEANANAASVCEQSARLQRELDAAYKRADDYKRILDDLFSDGECHPECDSYGHHDDCAVTNALATMEQWKQRADAAEVDAERYRWLRMCV